MAATAHGTLTANQITTVTVDPGPEGIEVINRSMSGVIWVRTDGQNPVAEGTGSYAVIGSRTFPQRRRGAPITVKLLSAEARAFSVEAI